MIYNVKKYHLFVDTVLLFTSGHAGRVKQEFSFTRFQSAFTKQRKVLINISISNWLVFNQSECGLAASPRQGVKIKVMNKVIHSFCG